MLFNSYQFLVFLPIVCLFAFLLPPKAQRYWLLIASYYFYMCWNAQYALLMLFSTLVTYLSGLWVDRLRRLGRDPARRGQKLVVFFCLAINLGILVFFKYFDFLLSNVNHVLAALHVAPLTARFDVLLPVGISFYTFQALSYTLDVYRNDIPAERNFGRYALFVSFFPQLVAGPIERSRNLLLQVEKADTLCRWDSRRVIRGLQIMIVGFVFKMIVADRLAMFVDGVFSRYQEYGSVALISAAVAFAFQIYCDFNGYTLIAIGAAKVLGFSLMENFNAPYLATNIAQFWKRWHISLTSWFRDYLYIPLGGSRCSALRQSFNVMVVFLVSGLWHGASWHFVVWGGLNGLFQIVSKWLAPLKQRLYKRLRVNTAAPSFRAAQVLCTFVLVDITWVFFRSESLLAAVDYLRCIFTRWDPWNLLNGSLANYGLSGWQIFIALAGLGFMALVDGLKHFRKTSLQDVLNRQNTVFRLGVYFTLTIALVLFGVYGPTYSALNFIYFQF